MSTKAKMKGLLDRWGTGEGRPFKGSLIDWEAYQAYQANSTDLGCMSAQGQVLNTICGWGPERLNDATQAEADKQVAEELGISRAHSISLRITNDSQDGAPAIVITNPGAVIGGQWSRLLDFWHQIDQLSHDQWGAAGDATWDATWDAAGAAGAAWGAAWGATWDAAGAAAGVAGVAWGAAGAAARGAAGEIQGSGILKTFFFLPLFGWDDPSQIPPRPSDYGLGLVPAN